MDVFLGIGLMVAIIVIASAFSKRISGASAGHELNKLRAAKQGSISSADKQKALNVYRELVKDKMDVIKTAIAMGYDENELKSLDDRLEQLIGKERLARIAEGQSISLPMDLQHSNLDVERQKLQELRQQSRS